MHYSLGQTATIKGRPASQVQPFIDQWANLSLYKLKSYLTGRNQKLFLTPDLPTHRFTRNEIQNEIAALEYLIDKRAPTLRVRTPRVEPQVFIESSGEIITLTEADKRESERPALIDLAYDNPKAFWDQRRAEWNKMRPTTENREAFAKKWKNFLKENIENWHLNVLHPKIGLNNLKFAVPNVLKEGQYFDHLYKMWADLDLNEFIATHVAQIKRNENAENTRKMLGDVLGNYKPDWLIEADAQVVNDALETVFPEILDSLDNVPGANEKITHAMASGLSGGQAMGIAVLAAFGLWGVSALLQPKRK